MRYETASLLLSGLATAAGALGAYGHQLRLRGGGIAGLAYDDFPPYFVAGAVYSGFAMVLTLAIPPAQVLPLEHLVTERHIDNMGKVMLTTGGIVAYGYGMEVFHGLVLGLALGILHDVESHVWADGLVVCGSHLRNIAFPLTTLWSRKLRNQYLLSCF